MQTLSGSAKRQGAGPPARTSENRRAKATEYPDERLSILLPRLLRAVWNILVCGDASNKGGVGRSVPGKGADCGAGASGTKV